MNAATPLADQMAEHLRRQLQPSALEVLDESGHHEGHAGANGTGFGTHFRVRIASPLFAGKTRVACHRLVYDALHPFIEQGVHAIAIETVRALLERGERDGVFRPGINPWHLHLLITSFCFIRVSNRYTWNAVFEMDLWEKDDIARQRQMIVEAVLAYVKPDAASAVAAQAGSGAGVVGARPVCR